MTNYKEILILYLYNKLLTIKAKYKIVELIIVDSYFRNAIGIILVDVTNSLVFL